MIFELALTCIQHIDELNFRIDLSENKLMCVVGKNGVGKTTLIRAIRNLKYSDTFSETASPRIFNEKSGIRYVVGEEEYDFKYNSKLQVIDTKSVISQDIKDAIHVELPIPHGKRFDHFRKLGGIDSELRKNISLKAYETPSDMIDFLSKIYKTDRFENLKSITIKKVKYYFVLKKDGFYIREDYLSSGEYFVINLYKMIRQKCKLIAIDEIDISLDASAQVNLINQLRAVCVEYEVNIVFTTHSLALMNTLCANELYYLEYNNSIATLEKKSYNYIKSLLFGFVGWDKYILTEDEVLEKYLTHLLSHGEEAIFFKYKIIYVGGSGNVINLMERNDKYNFFSNSENVISVLDGDQKDKSKFKNNKFVYFIPFCDVEKQLKEHYENGDGIPEVGHNGAKGLFKNLVKKRLMSENEIFSFINNHKKVEVDEFKKN